MASSDVRDILELGGDERNAPPTKASILKQAKKKSKKNENAFKRPEGMHRELYSLLYSDNRDQPPLIPTDTSQEYQTAKAKLGGCKVVRPWRWMPFTNPGRKDSAVFHHWRRAEDEGKDYQFAKFNKAVQIPVYSDQEYQLHLAREDWTREETDQLFDLCRRFDLRWFVIHDRYDSRRFSTNVKRSIEDMKERYYFICNTLEKLRAAPGQLDSSDQYVYDADHERRRKEQLEKLFERTREQVEEEERLLQELKKIETRKRERERKAQDLQKLIAAADSGMEGARRAERKSVKKKMAASQSKKGGDAIPDPKVVESASGIKYPDFKGTGVMLRSQRMKLPTSVSQKKMKAIEQMITDFNIDPHPMPTPEICQLFNELRSDSVLLYDLKMAHMNCEMDLQTLRYKWDTLAPGKILPSTSEPELKTEATAKTTMNSTIKTEVDQNSAMTGSDDSLIDVVNPSASLKRQSVTQSAVSNKKMKT